jgi:hypothetical protein
MGIYRALTLGQFTKASFDCSVALSGVSSDLLRPSLLLESGRSDP